MSLGKGISFVFTLLTCESRDWTCPCPVCAGSQPWGQLDELLRAVQWPRDLPAGGSKLDANVLRVRPVGSLQLLKRLRDV